MCINASPIPGHGNFDLHLLKEGRVYEVIEIHPKTGSLNIGIKSFWHINEGVNCYWGAERFIQCQDSEEPGINGTSFQIILKPNTNDKEGSDSEETKG